MVILGVTFGVIKNQEKMEVHKNRDRAILAMILVSVEATKKNIAFWKKFMAEYGPGPLIIAEKKYVEKEDYNTAISIRDALSGVEKRELSEIDEDMARLGMRKFSETGIFFNSHNK